MTTINELREKIRQLEEEEGRLRAALDYICWLSNIKNPHLGRPRLTDDKCIFCMAYFALNNGAYGEYISKKGYEEKLKKLKGGDRR